jgi:hypothetical protein
MGFFNQKSGFWKLVIIEIIKGSGNVVISSETEQNLLPFAGRILP